MKRLVTAASLGAIGFGLAACSDYDRNEAAYNEANASAYAEGEGGNYAEGAGGNYSGTATASAGWPAGTRIVVEDGVTYRIEPGGVRVALGPSDSRIVVENGVRYRVDPGGARVRIDESGAEVSIPVDANVTVNTQ